MCSVMVVAIVQPLWPCVLQRTGIIPAVRAFTLTNVRDDAEVESEEQQWKPM